MSEFTDDHLNRLLESHPDGDIHTTILELRGYLADLTQEVDPEKVAILTQRVRDYSTLLQHELLEEGRGGEDFVNDGVFHAAG